MKRLGTRLIVAQACDAATFLGFYVGVGAGIHAERNPLILGLMGVGGLAAVVGAKMGIVLYVAWRSTRPMGPSRFGPIRRFHERHPRVVAAHGRVRIIGLSTATASGVVGAAFNSAAIIHATTGFAIRL